MCRGSRYLELTVLRKECACGSTCGDSNVIVLSSYSNAVTKQVEFTFDALKEGEFVVCSSEDTPLAYLRHFEIIEDGRTRALDTLLTKRCFWCN